jgi:hypothetical protein
MGSGGSFNRIYSRYTQTVAIPDRQGIAKAQIIAEEKAKADPWSNNVPVPSFGPRMVCTRCGIIGADARPNWREQPARLSGAGTAPWQ